MKEPMKIKDLANYGVPSHIINIWVKDNSPYLLHIQEEAVREYGVLDSRFRGNDIRRRGNDIGGSGSDRGKGSTRLLRRDAPPLDY